ncbi:hypothetical protein Mzhil_0567 [Methanosalsum zhilinae DSM 4017]|uniref:Uncharacterized protein n=1 Tax=Methanosalsum zhilinae (strain DSM 4017 / NBRC 107636 / OCM 62 / WeN5) TaxID=679901 RepID=F7XQ70_METZD|nr:hypothetical protein [Methanosalsum zhilinae]AEH60434.1 hypothetical protein Mzhil_0567 [Methanosalsum zhilinae DSM 4017]
MMGNVSSEEFYESISDFKGENVHVVTSTSRYRGLCDQIDRAGLNILLKNVVERREDGWIEISDMMLIKGDSIESLFLEKSFPFESHEAIILSVEDGELTDNGNKDHIDHIE